MTFKDREPFHYPVGPNVTAYEHRLYMEQLKNQSTRPSLYDLIIPDHSQNRKNEPQKPNLNESALLAEGIINMRNGETIILPPEPKK